jgi:hypothetical protein
MEIRKQRAAFSLKLAASMTATPGAGVVNDYLILQYAKFIFGLFSARRRGLGRHFYFWGTPAPSRPV